MKMWTSPHGRALPVVGERTLIMAVLNVTPDSFSDGGQLSTPALVVARARELLDSGADVLDIGGESTRPGGTAISVDEELARVLPVISALRAGWPECPLSIDTYKSEVADAAIRQGADMINDVWGLTHGLTPQELACWRSRCQQTPSVDPLPAPSRMAAVAAHWKCPAFVMHNRHDRNYEEFWSDLLLDLKTSLEIANAAGIEPHQLWLDPGFGFAKNISQNLEVIRNLSRICALGFPVLVGTSRKSTLGAVLGGGVHDRMDGTAATAVWAIQQGCQMIRVHDVREMARFARMADAIKSGLAYPST